MRVIVTAGCALPRVGWLHASPEMIGDDATTRTSRSPIPIGDDALWNTGEVSWLSLYCGTRLDLALGKCSTRMRQADNGNINLQAPVAGPTTPRISSPAT